MSQPVNGTDILLYYHDTGTDTDIPFACGRINDFNINPTFKNVTDYTSAFFGKVKPDIISWSTGIEGIVILSNYSYLFITTLILARTPILIKYVVDNGSDGLVIYSGSCYPSEFKLSAPYNAEATYTTTLVGTGAFSQSGTQVTPGGIVISGGVPTRYQGASVSESTTLVISATIGCSAILEFNRGASNTTKIIYAGTPAGSEILFTIATGTFTAPSDNPFLAGEEVSGDFI